MQRTLTWLLLGLSVALLLSGCARGSQVPLDVVVDVTIEPSPPQVGPAMVTVDLHDSSDQPITGAAIELEGNMNHAGMVPSLANATETAPGQYQASLDLTMAGDWFVLVRADLPDGRSMEHRVDLPGVTGIDEDMSMPQGDD
jgi:hypothetical protein